MLLCTHTVPPGLFLLQRRDVDHPCLHASPLPACLPVCLPAPLPLQLVLDTEPLEPGRPASNTGRLAITRREVSTGGGAASSSTGAVATPGCHVLGYRLSEAGPAFLNHEQHSHPHIL
jgi:hypothetical protein